MTWLLDTHLLLWAANEPARLSTRARSIFENPAHPLVFSAASIWEIAIKSSLHRQDFRVEPRLLRRGLLDNGYRELPITGEHTLMTENLPPIHRDPFDRLLIAQAMVEGIRLLTMDATVARYPGPIELG